MRNKRKLTGRECYIEDDMTKQEREIQAAIRKRAREERVKCHEVKVGYQKIQINGKWENWTDIEDSPANRPQSQARPIHSTPTSSPVTNSPQNNSTPDQSQPTTN